MASMEVLAALGDEVGPAVAVLVALVEREETYRALGQAVPGALGEAIRELHRLRVPVDLESGPGELMVVGEETATAVVAVAASAALAAVLAAVVVAAAPM